MTVIYIYTIVIILFIVCSRVFYVLPLRKLLSQLGGKVNRQGEGVFPFAGRDIFLKFIPGSRNRSPELRVYTKGNFGAEALIRYENAFDRFYKQVGLDSEPPIPDRDITDKLYFECDDQDFLNLFFLNPQTKIEVFELLKNYTDIEINQNRCLLKKYPSPEISNLSKEDILKIAQDLSKLATLIPASGGSHPALVAFKAKKFFLYLIGTVVLIAGILSWGWASFAFRVVDPARLWMMTLNYGGAIVIAAVGFAYFIIRGFSTSSKVFIYFLLTFSIGAILCGRYGVAVYNGYHDWSLAHSFDQLIINKYTTTSKGSTTYHIIVQPWHAGMSDWESTVSSCDYGSIQLGVTRYRILTRAGRLGYEWVVYQRIKPYDHKDFSHEPSLPVNINGIDLENNALDIPINPLLNLNGMSREAVLSMRRNSVEKIPSLVPVNYQPSTEVFGKIEDGLPWWGLLGLDFYGPGKRSIEGPSRDSEFIANPYILVGVESAWTYPLYNPALAPKVFYHKPEQLKWDQGGAWGHVIYNVRDYYNESVNYDYMFPKELALNDFNARDLGFHYFEIDPSLSLNIIGEIGRILPIDQYIHRGASCAYPGGCNNTSPKDTRLRIKWDDLPARIYIKLWKARPKDASQRSDMDFIIDLT